MYLKRTSGLSSFIAQMYLTRLSPIAITDIKVRTKRPQSDEPTCD